MFWHPPKAPSCPRRSSAVAVGVAVGLGPAMTVVNTVDVLLKGGSHGSLGGTMTVLLSMPATVGVTTKITVALVAPGMKPKEQEIELVPVQVP